MFAEEYDSPEYGPNLWTPFEELWAIYRPLFDHIDDALEGNVRDDWTLEGMLTGEERRVRYRDTNRFVPLEEACDRVTRYVESMRSYQPESGWIETVGTLVNGIRECVAAIGEGRGDVRTRECLSRLRRRFNEECDLIRDVKELPCYPIEWGSGYGGHSLEEAAEAELSSPHRPDLFVDLNTSQQVCMDAISALSKVLPNQYYSSKIIARHISLSGRLNITKPLIELKRRGLLVSRERRGPGSGYRLSPAGERCLETRVVCESDRLNATPGTLHRAG